MAACFSCDAHASEAGLLAYDIVGDAVPAALGGLLGDPERGREIVLDRRSGNCLICHALPAIDQHFQGELGPALAGVGERLSTGQIRLRLIDQSRINATTIMLAEKIADKMRGVQLPRSTVDYFTANGAPLRSEPMRAYGSAV